MLSTRTKIALARAVQAPLMAARALSGRAATVRVRRGGVAWDLDLNEGIDFSIYLLGGFERRTLALYRKLVTPGMIVADIGANIGAHTLPLADLVGPSGRVLAFEPTRWASVKLQANLALNPILADRVRALQILLTDGATDLPASLPASWPLQPTADVHPILRSRSQSLDGATALSLDDYMAMRPLPHLDFIKLDVDGNETAVLTGARATIARYRPIILIEAMGYDPHGYDPHTHTRAGSHLELLESFGYKLDARGQHSCVEILRRLPVHGGINVLCRPA